MKIQNTGRTHNRQACDVKPSILNAGHNSEPLPLDFGSTFRKRVFANASSTSHPITEIKAFGPAGMKVLPLGTLSNITKYVDVYWTPSSDQTGEVIICYQAKDSAGKSSDSVCDTIKINAEPVTRAPESSTVSGANFTTAQTTVKITNRRGGHSPGFKAWYFALIAVAALCLLTTCCVAYCCWKKHKPMRCSKIRDTGSEAAESITDLKKKAEPNEASCEKRPSLAYPPPNYTFDAVCGGRRSFQEVMFPMDQAVVGVPAPPYDDTSGSPYREVNHHENYTYAGGAPPSVVKGALPPLRIQCPPVLTSSRRPLPPL
ncbi:uncharacterized protein LOC106151102 [Lingula anatina]|uniref:Uncharacterized protein LOC106151102 n=1 Tax=Lingula anatina TaxID=7574 RepID=A0A1S3H141_LINAN|nr:uncharacterized protein LOC106151102 [Lingula anatina]|eukprot:XP_013379652.1 uncharacterized protein LOC106151102 [Lingula anatina]